MINGTRYRLAAEINRQTELARDIARVQTQISSTKRLLGPSDDPGAAARIASIGRSEANGGAFTVNVRTAGALAAQADSVFDNLTRSVIRARELLLAGASQSLSASDRNTIAIELRSIVDEIGSLKETRDSRGLLLFADGEPLAVPVSEGVSMAAVGSRATVFDQVTTAAGTRSLEAIVGAAAAALTAADPATRGPAVTAALDATAAAVEHVANAHAEQGVRANRLDSLDERLADNKLQMTEERGALEGTDIPEAVAKLQARQLSLNAAQAVFARLNQTSLFDLLR